MGYRAIVEILEIGSLEGAHEFFSSNVALIGRLVCVASSDDTDIQSSKVLLVCNGAFLFVCLWVFAELFTFLFARPISLLKFVLLQCNNWKFYQQKIKLWRDKNAQSVRKLSNWYEWYFLHFVLMTTETQQKIRKTVQYNFKWTKTTKPHPKIYSATKYVRIHYECMHRTKKMDFQTNASKRERVFSISVKCNLVCQTKVERNESRCFGEKKFEFIRSQHAIGLLQVHRLR